MERGSLRSILNTAVELSWERQLGFARDTANGLTGYEVVIINIIVQGWRSCTALAIFTEISR